MNIITLVVNLLFLMAKKIKTITKARNKESVKLKIYLFRVFVLS